MSLRLLSLTLIVAGAMVFSLGCSQEETKRSDDESMPAAPTLPSLQTKLDARKVQFQETAPPDLVNTFETGVELVAASGVLESALKVGDSAPDFTLPGASGDSVTMSDLLRHGPVVLTWYRGGWCPYCNLQLTAYNDALAMFAGHRAHLVAVSPEIPDSAASTRRTGDLGFTVLSDVGNRVAEEFGIAYTLPDTLIHAFDGMLDLSAYNADSSFRLPLAATYVIDTSGVITYAFVDADYRKRAEPSAIMSALAELLR